LGQRELERMWSFLAIAEHKNRAVPAITMTGNDADYRQRVADTDARIRKFLVSSNFMTIPASIPPTMVAAERETPGIIATAWAKPTIAASP
jgi:hypothetical protein